MLLVCGKVPMLFGYVQDRVGLYWFAARNNLSLSDAAIEQVRHFDAVILSSEFDSEGDRAEGEAFRIAAEIVGIPVHAYVDHLVFADFMSTRGRFSTWLSRKLGDVARLAREAGAARVNMTRVERADGPDGPVGPEHHVSMLIASTLPAVSAPTDGR